MAQQIPGRAPNILDLFQMRALARRTPTTPERDLEGENRLKIELVKAITELEKTESEMKKATLTGMTDMLSKFATAQASMLSALADEAKAKAMTADAKAALLKTITGEFENINGQIAAGQPEESFIEAIKNPEKGIASIQTAFTSAVSNPDDKRAALIADLTPRVGSPERVGAGFDALVDMLDQEFVTGAGGMVTRINERVRDSSTPNMLVPNANAAMQQVAAGIAAAVRDMPNVTEDHKNLLFNALVTRAASSIEKSTIAAAGNVNVYTDYAATQSDALAGMNARRKEVFQNLGVRIDPALKKLFVDKFDAITGIITTNDPIAQLQVARDRLAARGIKPPDEYADETAKKAYNDQLTQEYSATIPMEGFAQRVATLPVSPEIAKQREYLKGLLGKVGEVPQDALTAATAQLRQSMGAEQFDAWRQMVRAETDEDAAVAAARNPGMLREFRGIVKEMPESPQAPAALRRLVAGAARDTAMEHRAAERADIRTDEAAQQAPPAPATLAPPYAAPGASPISPEDLLPAAPGMGQAAAPTPGVPPATPQGGMAMAPPPTRFEAAAEQLGISRAQLFGPGGVFPGMVRGDRSTGRTG
jgi:hypothetical protein